MKNTSKKIALTGLLATLGLLAFMLESLLPPLFIPGARMGISNVFILMAFFIAGSGYAFAVFLVKVVLGSLFSGNFSALLYSLPSGFIALLIQILLFKSDKFSVIAVSTLGGVLNLVFQNLTFCLITRTPAFLTYVPYLALIGVVAGFIVGLIVVLVKALLPQKYFLTNITNNTSEDSK